MMKRTISKVLLVQPPRKIYKNNDTPCSAPPLGIAYIAAAIENDYEVKILDAVAEGFWNRHDLDHNRMSYGLDFDAIEARIKQFAPDVVGISSIFTDQHQNARELAALVKGMSRDIITVIGGVHPTVFPEQVLREGNIDYIVLGEGEITFKELLKRLPTAQNISELDGIVFKADGDIKINPKKNHIENLDEVPFPARHLLPMELYSRINESHTKPIDKNRLPFTPIVTSRGCPAACTSCCAPMMWGKHKFRARSAENVLQEIDLLVSQGYKEIYFDDDNFTFDRIRINKILDGIIERKYDLTWSTPNGIALYAIDRPLLEKMRRAGCYSITLPIESCSQHVLTKIMRKPLNLKTVPALLKDMKDLGFETLGFFMIGFPEETRDDIEKTINGAVKLKAAGLDYASFFIVNPLPGTEIYYQCLQKGYIDKNLDLTKANYGKGLITTPEFDPEYLSKMRHSAWIKINFSLNTDFIFYPEETKKALEKIRLLNQGKTRKVFLCADAPEIEQGIRESGSQLNKFSDGQSLLDALEKTMPDYILMENDVRIISGWNVLRKMRKSNQLKDIPVTLIVKDDKEKLKGKDIVWYIQEVLDKKESYT